MGDTVIRIENVGKAYRLGAIGGATLREDVNRLWARLRGRPDPLAPLGPGSPSSSVPKGANPLVWALREATVDIHQGEVVGLIGRNGAGKSTLLKILSRVTAPTTGEVRIKGRVASLLEVGTGFHPELSGRENVFLNGAILGMSRAEVRRKFDEIVAFAEVEQYIDTPVKRYSSGMYVRLAFAVAAHLEAEILLVDEVLAVGDAEFQRKCLGKMGEVARGGKTVVFVSHIMPSIQRLCNTALLLDHGRLVMRGEVDRVVAAYLNSGEESCVWKEWKEPAAAPGDGLAKLISIGLRDSEGRRSGMLDVQRPFTIEMVFYNHVPGVKLVPNIHFFNSTGTHLFATATNHYEGAEAMQEGFYRAACEIPANLLAAGRTHIMANISSLKPVNTVHVSVPDALIFDILDTGGACGECLMNWPGVIRPMLDWQMGPVDSTSWSKEGH